MVKDYFLKKFGFDVVYGVSLREENENTISQIYEINLNTKMINCAMTFSELEKVMFETRSVIDFTDNRYSELQNIMNCKPKFKNYSGTVLHSDDIKLLEFVSSNTNVSLLESISENITYLCYLVLRRMFKDDHTVQERHDVIGCNISEDLEEHSSNAATLYCSKNNFKKYGYEWQSFYALVICQYYCGGPFELRY